jgi:uncharacterized integral membrane protein
MVDRSPNEATTTRRLTGGAIASLSGVGLLVIFMVQNTDDVKLDFLFWSFTWPLWLLCLVMALVGAIAWFGLGVLRRHRRRQERRADRHR